WAEKQSLAGAVWAKNEVGSMTPVMPVACAAKNWMGALKVCKSDWQHRMICLANHAWCRCPTYENGYSLGSTGFSRDTKSRFGRSASNWSSWSMMSRHISLAGRYVQPSSRWALALE